MPVITIEAAKLDDIEKKRQLVKRITDVASEVYGIPKDKFIILIKENPLENIGSGGELIADTRKK
jgi:4-oxalocrotonate tautomerase